MMTKLKNRAKLWDKVEKGLEPGRETAFEIQRRLEDEMSEISTGKVPMEQDEEDD